MFTIRNIACVLVASIAFAVFAAFGSNAEGAGPKKNIAAGKSTKGIHDIHMNQGNVNAVVPKTTLPTTQGGAKSPNAVAPKTGLAQQPSANSAMGRHETGHTFGTQYRRQPQGRPFATSSQELQE